VELFPAIDLRGGRCVRLVEGDFDKETVYGDDPLATAEAFAAAGATWIHMVDLDAARTGEPINRAVIAAVAASVGPQVRVQTGGGVRTEDDVKQLLESGVARVIIGTAALEKAGFLQAMCDDWPGRIAAGVDHRDGEVRLRGWLEGAGVSVADAVGSFEQAGAAAVVVTDISRDGKLTGPDLAGLGDLLDRFEVPVIASGGVSGKADLEALARLRSSNGCKLAGVIVGKAIYEGRVDVGAALEALAGPNR
jgi:phosphoribosylformimino-5-aminoimidazole carboxamide ribotide isomerase